MHLSFWYEASYLTLYYKRLRHVDCLRYNSWNNIHTHCYIFVPKMFQISTCFALRIRLPCRCMYALGSFPNIEICQNIKPNCKGLYYLCNNLVTTQIMYLLHFHLLFFVVVTISSISTRWVLYAHRSIRYLSIIP